MDAEGKEAVSPTKQAFDGRVALYKQGNLCAGLGENVALISADLILFLSTSMGLTPYG